MDPRFLRLKKAVSSRPFLMFLFFVVVLIVLTSIYVGLSDDSVAGTEVYWYVAVAIVAVIAIIFLISAFLCPTCMTPAREAPPDEPVSYHRNPERVSIGHDNYGADIQPNLQSVESSVHFINENPISLVFGSVDSSSGSGRSYSAHPGPGYRRTHNSPIGNTPPPAYSDLSSRAASVNSEPAGQTSRSRSLTFTLATSPSEPENDLPHLAESTPLPPDTTDAVQDRPNVALAEPSPPSGAENESEAGDNEEREPELRYSTPQASPETQSLNLNQAASSSPSTHTGSSTTIDSNSALTSVSTEDRLSGSDQNAQRVIASDLPFYTGQSVVESIAAMQRISAERHSGLSFVHQSTRTLVNLRQWRGASLHPSDVLSHHGSVENAGSSVTATPVPEDDESVVAPHAENSVVVGEEESVVASRAESSVLEEEEESVVASCAESFVLEEEEEESVVASCAESSVLEEEEESVVASRAESSVLEEEEESVVASRAGSSVLEEEEESVVASRAESSVLEEEEESVVASHAESSVLEEEEESVVASHAESSVLEEEEFVVASRVASPVPEEQESVVASRVASPVPEEEKEPASHSHGTIDMEDYDDVETEFGLVLQLTSSLLGAAWSSVSRWVRPQRDSTTSVPTEASPGSPPSTERRIILSPASGNEPSSEDPASGQARANIVECTEPSQQGEDVVPPERRERP